MTLGILRFHAIIFPLSYQDDNISCEIDQTNDSKVRFAVSNYLSFWLDNLFTQQYSITELSPFS